MSTIKWIPPVGVEKKQSKDITSECVYGVGGDYYIITILLPIFEIYF